jgi:choline kinase
MKAIMLAAGVGGRLSNKSDDHPPKSLLKFNGHSLLARHIEILKTSGVSSLTMVIGYRSQDIFEELTHIGVNEFVETRFNPDFKLGSVVSLWAAKDVLISDDDVLILDADVLYHPSLIQKLMAAENPNSFLYDKNLEEDDEPVKLCLRNGHPVEFRKIVEGEYDEKGESIGFIRLSSTMANKLAVILDAYMDDGKTDQPHEEALRDLLLSSENGAFGVVDVTGRPWIEIDFPEDVRRAQDEILPAIENFR